MNDAQKVQLALSHLRRMQVTWHEWEMNVKAGKYANPGATEGGKAKALLDEIGKPAPAPAPPPASTVAQLARRIVFCAWNPQTALNASPTYTIALTADVHVECATDDDQATRERKAAEYLAKAKDTAKRQHDRGSKVAAWGVQTQIGVDAIREFGKQIAADFLIFQAETPDEFDTAITAGAQVIVGNPNSWTQDQRDYATKRINAGTLALAFETYTNLGAPWPKDSTSSGVPEASFVVGVWDGTDEVPGKGWHPSLAAYKDNTPPAAWPNVCVYHAAAVNPDEWKLLA